jgi:hypothetical protein
VFPDLSSDAARRELEPFHERFIAAIREGVRKFNTIEPSLLYPIFKRKRAKANAIWAFIQEEIEATFRDVQGLELKERYETIEVHIGTNMVARIKKMRPDGMTANYRTARVTEFHTAEQGELFAMMWAKPMRVDIGYIEDETGTQVAQIMVAHRRSPRSIHWTYPMLPPADVTPMPVEPTPTHTPSTGETRVVGRKPENKDKEQEARGTDDE